MLKNFWNTGPQVSMLLIMIILSLSKYFLSPLSGLNSRHSCPPPAAPFFCGAKSAGLGTLSLMYCQISWRRQKTSNGVSSSRISLVDVMGGGRSCPSDMMRRTLRVVSRCLGLLAAAFSWQLRQWVMATAITARSRTLQ
uniref:Uncharacterized protein n=1 Tax=Ixodes ricinus TaxID=34613 RepID=A0A6B0UTM3_IXORI